MSDATQTFRPFTVEHGGKTWTLRRPNIATERDYSAYLERKSSAFLARQRDSLGLQSYQDALRIHLANAVNNWFGWCRPGFMESLSDPTNAAKFLWSWFSQCGVNGVVDGIADEKAMYVMYAGAGNAALNTVLNEALSDPNPLLPE